MRWRLPGLGFVLLGLTLACGLAPPELPEPRAEAFVLPQVRRVEPGRLRAEPADLWVGGGRIQAAGSAVRVPPHLEEYRGTTVLPGLVDMHTHLPPETPLQLTSYFGLLYLAHGVTAVRDAGDLDGSAVPAARRALRAGAPMPRIVSCGPFVGAGTPRWANWVSLERVEAAPGIAERLREAGHGCVKVYDGLDEPRVRALVAAAEAAGLRAMGHVPFGLTVEQARIPDTQHLMGVAPPERIEAGDHVVHRVMDWRGVDAARIDAVVRESVRLGIAHTPTLGLTHQLLHYGDYSKALEHPVLRWMPGMYLEVVWHPQQGLALYRNFGERELAILRDAWPKKLQLVRKLHEAGVPLFLGSDTQQPFVVPGASLWDELRHFVAAGVPAEAAWAHASWRSGEALAAPGLGRLAPGAPADLLVFAEDPTRNLAALDSLVAVVAQGRLYRQTDLWHALGEWRAWYGGRLIDFASRTVARRRMRAAVESSR